MTEHTRAVNAGLNPRQAARWLRYLDMKARRGETPITLDEAARQCREAKS